MVSERAWEKMVEFSKWVIAQNGKTFQVVKCAEELGELQQEMFKALTGRTNFDNIAEEMADVLIVMSQMKIMFDVSSAEIEDWIAYKVHREREKK